MSNILEQTVRLPDKAIQEYKTLNLAHIDVKLSDEEARARATNLIGLHQLVYCTGRR